MKPVNLLPSVERPRAVANAPAHASTAVIVALGLVLLAVAGWVFTKNQINDRKTAIATAERETAEANRQSQGLKAFGDFSQIKQTRVQSITDLATKRFDWERFMRELALVLPDKVWVSEVSAGGNADEAAASGSDGGQTATPASGAGRTVTLKACSPSQKSVAATMVRLRTLYGAQEVDLKDSSKSDSSSGSSTTDGGGSAEGCGRYYGFTTAITFAQPTGQQKGSPVRAPSRLGGGA